VPLKVAFQDIRGKKLDEIVPGHGLFDRILPIGDSSFPLLGWIDPYSNTLFNSNQMYRLLGEIDRSGTSLSDEIEMELVARLRKIAVECRDRPQTYIRFIGD
jgi:hypothetical protein